MNLTRPNPDSPSSPVRSGQLSADSGIAARQRRRSSSDFRRPIAEHNQRAFAALRQWRQSHCGELILDAGCGTGASTLRLSELHPHAWVLGVDKTLARLQQRGLDPQQSLLHSTGRCCFLLADLVDLWRLMASEGWHFSHQYLLYPNPWPKPAQRLRRWPLHPIWPQLLQLSGQLELRSNWSIYAEEAAQALSLAGWTSERSSLPPQETPISPFEAKYQASGHALWRVIGRRGD